MIVRDCAGQAVRVGDRVAHTGWGKDKKMYVSEALEVGNGWVRVRDSSYSSKKHSANFCKVGA